MQVQIPLVDTIIKNGIEQDLQFGRTDKVTTSYTDDMTVKLGLFALLLSAGVSSAVYFAGHSPTTALLTFVGLVFGQGPLLWLRARAVRRSMGVTRPEDEGAEA